MQKQQQAKEAEATAAASQAAPTEAAEARSGAAGGASDQEKKNLVHAWVMVLAGKREVTHSRLLSECTRLPYDAAPLDKPQKPVCAVAILYAPRSQLRRRLHAFLTVH